MVNHTANDLESSVLNCQVSVVHAVKEHEEVLFESKVHVKLFVHVLKHCASNLVLRICGGYHDEFLNHSFKHIVYGDSKTDLLIGDYVNGATGLDCRFSYLRVFIVKKINYIFIEKSN